MPENGSDILKGQLAEHPQAEHLFIGFFQRVQALVHRKGGILVHQQLGNVRRVGGLRLSRFQRGGMLCLAAAVCFALRQRSYQQLRATVNSHARTSCRSS